MTAFRFAHLCTTVVVCALLASCGGLQPPINVPGATQESAAGMYRAVPAPSYRIVHLFRVAHGAHPAARLLNVNGTLYGTTFIGGANGDGVVYSMTTTGKEKLLYSFAGGSDGAFPDAGLINVNGTLYGTTSQGGGSQCSRGGGCGTVFSVTTTGMEKILHRFRHYSDGAYPNAGLTNVNGTLFGTTWLGGSGCGGSGSCGTVYSVTTTGKEKVVYSFAGGSDGANPLASLKEVKGVLYGTTENGGGSGCFSRGCGTVFSITTTGTEKVLHRFGVGSDGANPVAGLIDVKGTLYGTTENGGSTRCGNGCGTMYSISTSGTEKVLHAFDKETAFPAASLIDVNGTLYGTTASGVNRDAGTVFKATTTGVVRVLHYFDFITDGGDLRASLLNVNGTLYGTTYYGPPHFGRPHYWGTVFTVVP